MSMTDKTTPDTWECTIHPGCYHGTRSPCPRCVTDSLKIKNPDYVPPCPDFAPIKAIGKKHGYMIAEHGSKDRDYDLVAVPWTTRASKQKVLINALCNELDASIIGEMERKPHGRLAVILQRDKWEKHWDLSVCSPEPYCNTCGSAEQEDD